MCACVHIRIHFHGTVKQTFFPLSRDVLPNECQTPQLATASACVSARGWDVIILDCCKRQVSCGQCPRRRQEEEGEVW